jgi:hypothetical protein
LYTEHLTLQCTCILAKWWKELKTETNGKASHVYSLEDLILSKCNIPQIDLKVQCFPYQNTRSLFFRNRQGSSRFIQESKTILKKGKAEELPLSDSESFYKTVSLAQRWAHGSLHRIESKSKSWPSWSINVSKRSRGIPYYSK